MNVVVDANIVISMLISGNSADIFQSSELTAYAPEFLFTEIEANLEEIHKRSALDSATVHILLKFIKRRTQTVRLIEILPHLKEAESILRNHPKDTPYVALTLCLKCPLWTYERRLLGNAQIRTITTKEIRLQLAKKSRSLL